MRQLRRARLDDVVAAWLQAEVASPRFGHHLRLGDIDRQIIERPDLNDPAQNALRRQLLRYRAGILGTIPDDTEWWAIELAGEELAGLFASNYLSWNIYSGETGRLVKVAEAIRQEKPPRAADPKIQEETTAIQENVCGIYRSLSEGKSVGPLILLARGATGPFTVIEGTKRATALCWRHCLDAAPCPGIPAFVGITTGPCPWLSLHAGPPPT